MAEHDVKELERIILQSYKPDPFTADGYKAMVTLPEGVQLTSMDAFLEQPRNIHRFLEARDIDTLMRYWDKWSDPTSEIFADLDDLQILLRLDEHIAEDDTVHQPMWGYHTAVYNCPKSREWKEWEEHDGNRMSQEEFGDFLEDRAAEVIEPMGTDLLALTQHFAVGQEVSYSKAVRQQDGNIQFAYSQTNAANGAITIPERFKLGLSPFHNGKPYELEARFRYRIVSGSLTMWYDLIEPWRVIEHAFNEVISDIEEATKRDVSRVVMHTL